MLGLLTPAKHARQITGYAEAFVVSHGRLDAGMADMTKSFALDVLANRVRAMIEALAALAS